MGRNIRSRSCAEAVTGASVLIADFVTKRLAEHLPQEGVPLIRGVVRLKTVRNTGAAFSFLSGSPRLALILSAAVLLALGAYLALGRLPRPMRRSLTAVVAGGLGNLIDRVFFGAVTDMIMTEFVQFPVFNVADIAVTLGSIGFAVSVLKGSDSDAQ